ncbi:MAG: 1-deoxy-D-xylulose-5-phosphate synthase [Firmicutes bacterium]|nr:1-deoxy-D-xylulose-5-phosphate synthase [Bacillota bacterium]
MLETILSPLDVRNLTPAQAEALALEIRQVIIDTVARTGGHLASNLGTVELTLALHRVLDLPRDKIIFDVGHQCYTHKLLTGRQSLQSTLRSQGGVSGFPKRSESEYDVFETGHASTALSAALGMARARDLLGERHTIVALVGDGALTGGMCYEALNDAGSRPTQLILLLNDNEMSIARNVGALSTYLTRLRGSKRWIGAKRAVKRGLNRLPLVGAPLARTVERMKRTVKLMLIPGEFFEALGFAYLGPIDGHDIAMLENTLADARAMNQPVVIHAVTQKGRGYALAERKPEAFHGAPPFFVESGHRRAIKKNGVVSAASVAGETLAALAQEDARVVAITAAMPHGTGLLRFASKFPDRFFDVGIAEEHAVTLAAGMASSGLRPVFAVYASFLQRGMDQLAHDVCLQNLPVLFLIDHAGFIPGDGATHQGIYDLPMLRAMPGLTVFTPCDSRELAAMIRAALTLPGPCAVRYPKDLPEKLGETAPCGRWRRIVGGDGPALVGAGHAVLVACETAGLLRAQGVRCAVWSASSIVPLDTAALEALGKHALIAVLEEGVIAGGLGEAIAGHYAAQGKKPQILRLGVEGDAPGAHSIEGLLKACGIDPPLAAERILGGYHAK